jgi:DNA repair exonuclease SbcCD ATPase subunit
MTQLSALIAKTKDAEKNEKLQEQLDALEADRDLASDEVDDAQQDFRRAGGDLENRLQEAQKEHKAAQQGSRAVPVAATAPPEQFGLIHRYEQWSALHAIQLQLWKAKQDAESAVNALSAQHNALEATITRTRPPHPEEEIGPCGQSSCRGR